MLTVTLRSFLLTAVMAVLFTPGVFAQEGQSPREIIEEIRADYRQLEYEQAEQPAREVLAEYQQLTIDQLIEVHRLLGLIEISQNDRTAARRHFEAALSLSPDLTLDPTFVSPKIIDFFQEVRGAYLAETGRPVPDSAAVRYRLISDPRPEAALRSAVLPGWGQLYKGETGKGRLLMGAWGVSAGGAVLTHVFGRLAENSSGSGTGGVRAEWWNGARNGLAATAAATWLVSYLDALLTGERSSRSMHLFATPDPRTRTRVTFQMHF